MRATVLLVVLLIAAVGSAVKKPTACTGRFGLDRSLVTGLPGTEVIDITRRRVTLSSCGTAKARLHVRRHATRLQAVFAPCPGIRGKARLRARIAAPACLPLEGTFRATPAGIP